MYFYEHYRYKMKNLVLNSHKNKSIIKEIGQNIFIFSFVASLKMMITFN